MSHHTYHTGCVQGRCGSYHIHKRRGVAPYISHRMCTRPVWKLLHTQEEGVSHHTYHTGGVLGRCGRCYIEERVSQTYISHRMCTRPVWKLSHRGGGVTPYISHRMCTGPV